MTQVGLAPTLTPNLALVLPMEAIQEGLALNLVSFLALLPPLAWGQSV